MEFYEDCYGEQAEERHWMEAPLAEEDVLGQVELEQNVVDAKCKFLLLHPEYKIYAEAVRAQGLFRCNLVSKKSGKKVRVNKLAELIQMNTQRV